MSRTQNRSRQASGPDFRVIAAVVGVGLLIAVFAVIAISAGDDTADTGPEFGAVEVPSAVLPVLPEVGADPAVGAVGPTIRSERPEGTATVDPSSAGEPTVLFFLAHWCSHCQAELPRLVTAANAGTFDDVRTVAVLTSSDPAKPNHPPSAWLEREGWTGETFYDDANSSAGTAYGLSSFPFMVFMNADGTISQRIAGEQTPEAIEAAVEAIAPSQA